jgi:hypothetical protein
LNRLFNLAGRKASRSLQFEFKLLTKFLHLHAFHASVYPLPYGRGSETLTRFAFNQIVKHLRIATLDFAKEDYMPASKAVRPQSISTQGQHQSVTGRFDYNQKIGGSERTASERGLSGLQSEILPLPRLAANPPYRRFSRRPNNANFVLSGAHCINYSSKLMSAAQELFQLFCLLIQPTSCSHSCLPLRSTTKPEYQTVSGDASGLPKYFYKSGK